MRSHPPKPRAISKLAYFVGRWMVEGEIAPGPWGAGGKFSWRENTRWMKGNFFVVGHWDFKMPRELGGDGVEIFIMGYDAQEKRYTFDAFSSQGLHQVSRGEVRGQTWLWTSQAHREGRMVRQRMTMKIISRKSYTLKFEISEKRGDWIAFLQGRATRRSM